MHISTASREVENVFKSCTAAFAADSHHIIFSGDTPFDSSVMASRENIPEKRLPGEAREQFERAVRADYLQELCSVNGLEIWKKRFIAV